MGHVLSLTTVYEIARIAVPAFFESLVRDIDREQADARLADFAQRVVERTCIQLYVEGREQIPTNSSYVFMGNHQSHMDIPVVYATCPVPTLRMVGKKELFRIPIWSRAMRAGGFIEIDRKNLGNAIASLERAATQLNEGVSIWIAPEGSRSKTGQLAPLKKGGFHLAKNTGKPIVPVAISGTRAILPPGATKTNSGCHVRVTYGAPIEVRGRDIDELVNEVSRFLRDNNGRG